MNGDYKIRTLQEKDLVQISELYSLFWGDVMNVGRMCEKFNELTQNKNYIFLCMELNGKILGTIQGIICEEIYGDCLPFLVMENFVVREEFRGLGVGKSLLRELEKIGKEKGCSQIIFITETNRQDAVKFYEKMGYDSAFHKGFKKSLI